MKKTVQSIAAFAALGIATPALAGGMTVAEKGDSKLKLEAKFFLNTKFTTKKNQAGTTGKTMGLAVDRAYLGVKYYFNDDWMMRITTDVHVDTNLAKKNSNIFLKYAYVEGKLAGKAAVLRLGQSHTPWIDYEQHLWKHRYVSKVFIDTKGFDASSDLGIGLKGKLADGLVEYWITETAGAGYSHPGMHKDVVNGTWAKGVNAFDLDSRISFFPVKGMTLDFQLRSGYKGTKYWDTANSQTTPGTKHTLYQVMATYGEGHDWRAGVNYVSEKSDRKADALNGVTARQDKTNGYALWAWANMGDGMGAFGRYEYDKVKRTGTAIQPKTTRYLLGVEYSPVKHVSFSLAYDYSKTSDSGFTAGNFKKATTFGLYSQVKF